MTSPPTFDPPTVDPPTFGPPTFGPPKHEPLNGSRHITPHPPEAARAGRAIATLGAVAWLAPADPVAHAVMIEHTRRGGLGRELVERTAALIGAAETRTYPPLMLAAGDADGIHVLVHGRLDVSASVAHADRLQRQVTLTSEINDPLIRTFTELAALHVGPPAGHVVAIDPLTELTSAVVLASGLSVRWDGRPAPPVPGALIFDTGEVFDLTSDVSIGRSPTADNLVTSGLARALTPSGDVSGLSRVHASIHLDGRHVLLKDRGSLNGTFIWERQQRQWVRIEPHVATPIALGDMVGFGRRSATFQASTETPL